MANFNSAEAAVVVIVKVRSADAPDLDLHPHVISTEGLVRHLLVAQIVGSVDDYGFHWACPAGEFRIEART